MTVACVSGKGTLVCLLRLRDSALMQCSINDDWLSPANMNCYWLCQKKPKHFRSINVSRAQLWLLFGLRMWFLAFPFFPTGTGQKKNNKIERAFSTLSFCLWLFRGNGKKDKQESVSMHLKSFWGNLLQFLAESALCAKWTLEMRSICSDRCHTQMCPHAFECFCRPSFIQILFFQLLSLNVGLLFHFERKTFF